MATAPATTLPAPAMRAASSFPATTTGATTPAPRRSATTESFRADRRVRPPFHPRADLLDPPGCPLRAGQLFLGLRRHSWRQNDPVRLSRVANCSQLN